MSEDVVWCGSVIPQLTFERISVPCHVQLFLCQHPHAIQRPGAAPLLSHPLLQTWQ